jgi:lipopolysaccharide/colanic/teichoic acid biosynthesis glycosyltransferase
LDDPVVLDVGSPLPLWKRGLDLLFLAVTLPLFLPVGLGIALFIKWHSRGPVIFRQERVGYRGRRFELFKFRTMRLNAEVASHRRHLSQLMQSDAPLTKLDAQGDPRLIPGGALLRASGLDELPQLINVLRGEMSVVGPRPCLPYEYEEYSDWEKQRLAAVPGLTGLWQVSGKNKTTFRQMIALDIEYARTKTLGRDVGIMGRTLATLMGQVRETRRPAEPAVLLPTPEASREAA